MTARHMKVVHPPIAAQFALPQALLMDAVLGLIVYWIADLTGWMVVAPKANDLHTGTWLLTMIIGAFIIVAIDVIWFLRPDWELACWRFGTSVWMFAILALVLLIMRISLQLNRPLETAPWKEQVLWGSLLNSWWGMFYIYIGCGLAALKRAWADNEPWPWSHN